MQGTENVWSLSGGCLLVPSSLPGPPVLRSLMQVVTIGPGQRGQFRSVVPLTIWQEKSHRSLPLSGFVYISRRWCGEGRERGTDMNDLTVWWNLYSRPCLGHTSASDGLRWVPGPWMNSPLHRGIHLDLGLVRKHEGSRSRSKKYHYWGLWAM